MCLHRSLRRRFSFVYHDIGVSLNDIFITDSDLSPPGDSKPFESETLWTFFHCILEVFQEGYNP